MSETDAEAGGFAVVVDFVVRPDRVAAFREAMLEQARNSLELEEGCLQFDVFTEAGAPGTFVLYELYRDEDAFELHLASAHFAAFAAHVEEMVEKRMIRRLHRTK